LDSQTDSKQTLMIVKTEPASAGDSDSSCSGFKKLVIAGDAKLTSAWPGRWQKTSTLLIFAIHCLFDSAEEIARGEVDPQQALTTSMFRSFAANLEEHGYRFVSPKQILAGLDPAGRYAMITFDDGYANNRRALPVLEEFQAPAVFCISTNHVATGKPFWWDVLYRGALQRGWPVAKLEAARAAFKRLRTSIVERQLACDFGTPASHTVSDLDRPFTQRELAEFAAHPLVHIGNHTCDHAILTNYSPAEARQQIQCAQKWLQELTGQAPLVVAYPNGAVSKPVVLAARDAGLHLGMTVQPGPNRLASARSTPRSLLLKRNILWGTRDIATQCRIAQSPLSLQAAWAALQSKLPLFT
jgi:peptidoglycan/xylan/chitin deacetylase (PgdA/CDA1 family)